MHYAETSDAVDTLALHGSEINAFNAYGHSPLHVCMSHGLWSVALRLLCHGHNPDATAERHQFRRRFACPGMTPAETVRATLATIARAEDDPSDRRWEALALKRCLYILDVWRRAVSEVRREMTTLRYMRRAREMARNIAWRRRWGSVVPCAMTLRRVEMELIYGPFCGVLRCVSRRPLESLSFVTAVPRHLLRLVIEDYLGVEGFVDVPRPVAPRRLRHVLASATQIPSKTATRVRSRRPAGACNIQ